MSQFRRKVSYPALIPGTPEWTAKRRTLIGASEVPALFGAEGGDEYKSRFQLHLEKTGKSTEDPRDPASPASIGNALEHGIGLVYQHVNQDRVLRIERAYTEHDDVLPFFAATPDFDCYDAADNPLRTHAVQIKNRGGFPQGWGEVGTDQVPRAVLLQVHAELTVTQLPFIDVAALLSGNRYVQYRIHRDDEVGAEIRTVVMDFWQTHVVRGVEPAIEGPGVSEYFKKKFAVATTEIVLVASAVEELEALARVAQAKEAVKAADLEEGNAVAVCQSLIGLNRGMEHPEIGRALWYNTAGRRTISEESLRKALRTFNGPPDVAVLNQAQIEEIVLAATKKGDDYRTFKFTPAK